MKHLVPKSRLTRNYFRRWFFWHGRTLARMADAVYLDLDLALVPSVGGVPRFVYREFLQQFSRWLRRAGRPDALALLIEEVMLIEYLGFFVEARRGRPPARGPSPGSSSVASRARAGERQMTAEESIRGTRGLGRPQHLQSRRPPAGCARGIAGRRRATCRTRSSSSTTIRRTTRPAVVRRIVADTRRVGCDTRSSRVRACRTDETPGSRSLGRPSSR